MSAATGEAAADEKAQAAAAGEKALAAALRWVCVVLGDCGIPFQVTGDAAAMAHRAGRLVRRLEICIAAEHVPALVRAAGERVVDHPWRRLDAAWDRVALSLSHDGTVIDVWVAEAARLKDAGTGEWREAAVDPEASVTMEVWNVEAPVTPREQLLEQMRRLDRRDDRQDVRDILTAARRTAGSASPSAGR